jgi:hypothetical protein
LGIEAVSSRVFPPIVLVLVVDLFAVIRSRTTTTTTTTITITITITRRETRR